MTALDFRKRASSIYDGQRDREKRRLAAALPKGVHITLKGEDILPYTRQQFYDWLWEIVGLEVIRCPYCGAFIDINTLAIDHKIPLALGGDPGLNNQEPTCPRCNRLKSALLPEEFRALEAFLEEQSPHLRSHVESCLLSGPEGKARKFGYRNLRRAA